MIKTNKLKSHKKLLLRTLVGILLLTASYLLAFYNMWESNHAGKASEQILEELKERIEKQDSGSNIQNQEDTSVIINREEYIGILHIPSLDLTLPIMKEWDYEKLKMAPCRYHGTIEENNIIIAGHNYQSHFSRIKKLKEGAELLFTDLENQTYRYKITDTEVIGEKDNRRILEGDWDLTLFTCTYGGEERFVVRCVRKTGLGNPSSVFLCIYL